MSDLSSPFDLPAWLMPPSPSSPPPPPSPSPIALAALEKIKAREQAQTALEHYARQVVGVIPALHHRVICEAIDDLLADSYDELIILAPPGSAKSTYTSIALASYFLGRWPTKHILTASYSTELAEKWGRKVRGIVDSPEHQLIFPASRLSRESAAAGRWSTTQGGEFYGAGVGSGILGFRADLGLIDDPISGFEQAQSITQLQKMYGWYETDFVTRLKPNAKTVLICQRLSRNDLAGYLIDRNLENPTRRQRVLKLPMEATLPPDLDPVGRQVGDRLWPEWFTPEMVIDAKRDDYKWRTLYQQEPPSDDGSWVSPGDIKIVEPVDTPSTLNHYLLSDLALSVNTGDYSVHVTVGIDHEHNIYVVDAWRDRVSPEVTVERHLALSQTYKPMESLIDDDNAAKVYVQLLAQRCRETGIHVPWKTMPMRGQDKETRAAPLRGWFKRGKVFLVRGEWNRWLVKELLTFPNATGQGVDDGVDALGLIGRRLASLARTAPAPVARPREKYVHEMTMDDWWGCHTTSKRRI